MGVSKWFNKAMSRRRKVVKMSWEKRRSWFIVGFCICSSRETWLLQMLKHSPSFILNTISRI